MSSPALYIRELTPHLFIWVRPPRLLCNRLKKNQKVFNQGPYVLRREGHYHAQSSCHPGMPTPVRKDKCKHFFYFDEVLFKQEAQSTA